MDDIEPFVHYSIFKCNNNHHVPAYWYTCHMRIPNQQPVSNDQLVARLTSKKAFNASCHMYGFEPLSD